ncbi:geranyl transferase [Campylobacter sp. MIT 99-7217]|uniref:polyprenyl synthetase family protein n=1 Tax=Campylobacter sp. MIT 99-7217 TaxID=535091 RepID=UPI00115C306C|nr:polyprenyl synthetase family protein [Campylobacter sp. MIT 99-7217]TQR32354.1 geranyl transferase [Campylobacter sp. MIT 99-7217]
MSLEQSFQEYLKANLPSVQSFHPFFNEALSNMLLAGGKHFRAKLLLSVVTHLKPSEFKKALQIALALECIHTYSLIHDDLPAMDNADFRRGKPTLHKLYDETTAILVGDALNTEAFLLIAKSEFKDEIKTRLSEILAFNAGLHGMVLGQAIDCFFEGKRLNLEELEFLHLHKTARLIAASLEMGAIICELENKQCKSLYEFGLKLGLLFQINDDIIDFLGDEKSAGKPTKHDTQKNSFVNLLGIENALKSKEKLSLECENLLLDFDEKLAFELKNLMQKYL